MSFKSKTVYRQNAEKLGKQVYFRKKDCTGCHACANACPKQCISMKADEEGFLYPQIDKSKCINCNLCDKVCPVKNKKKNHSEILQAYGAYNKDLDVRMKSSSGGIFSLLADFVLDRGGAVVGVGLNDKFEAEHMLIEKKEDLQKLRVSKYVQSRVGDSFKKAKELLDKGREVLFTGTACQIEGLYAYLRKDYDNLYCQDLICHGAPSPLVWKRYVDFRRQTAGCDIKNIAFRRKFDSWSKYKISFQFEDGSEYNKQFNHDPMMRMFLFNRCLRPSCYSCVHKELHRKADITLADFWGVKKVLPHFNDDKGASLVIVHSKKGQQMFEAIKEKMVVEEVDIKRALKRNPLMKRSAYRPMKRWFLMKDVKKNLPFKKMIRRHGNYI